MLDPQALAQAAIKQALSRKPDLKARAEKIYGSWEAYQKAVAVLAPDQRNRFERAGVALQPVQIIFVNAARACDAKDGPEEIGIGGARGGSKSFSVFAQAAIDDCQRFPGLKVLYLRKTAKAGQEQMQDLVQATLSHVDCEPLATRISFPNGSRIIIGGFKDDKEALKYQGLEYDILIIEELTQLTLRTYKTLRLSARSSKGWRPRVYATFNPLGVGHQWVKQRFVDPYRQGTSKSTVFIPATIKDNVFNNPEYVRNLEDLTGAELRAFRFGEWDVASGAYFETWDYDTHTIPALDAKAIPAHWRKWAAMDAGFQHWNMVYFFAEDGDGNTYVFHEIAHRKHHPATIGPDIHAGLAQYSLSIQHLNFFTVGTDAFRLVAGQQSTLADQYALLNIGLTAADMSPGSRIMGWQLISRLMGDPRDEKKQKPSRLFITRNCRMLIETLPYAERDPHNPEDVKKWDTDEDGNGGDDPIDCLRYGLLMAQSGIDNFMGGRADATYDTLYGAQ